MLAALITVTQAGIQFWCLFFSTKLGFWTVPRWPQARFPRLRARLRNGEHDYAAVLPSDTPKWNGEIFNRSDQPSAGPTPDRDESLRFQVQTSETGPGFRGREPGFKKQDEAKKFYMYWKSTKRAPKKSICDDNNPLKGHKVVLESKVNLFFL